MKFRSILFLLMTSASLASADSSDTALKSGNLKFAIQSLQQQLSTSKGSERGSLEAKLAIAYFKDQEQEKAFATFLKAMNDVAPKPAPALTEADKSAYEEALKIYLDVSKLNPLEISDKIEENYAKILEASPNNYLLGYILSLAYANLDEFDKFFDLFYKSYQVYPEHFLAYKTKAILHVKMLERARTAEEREQNRQEILSNVQKAISMYPQDTTLYKLAITFSPESKKDEVLESSLNHIMEKNITIPRVDIPFYVQQGIDANKFDLIQKFITKAREWYSVSRVLDAAQQYLDQQRGN